MDIRTALTILAIAYLLEASVWALDGAYFALIGQFDKRKFFTGIVRELGFTVGIFVLIIGSSLIPPDLILVSIGTGSVSMNDVASLLLVAYLTQQLFKFVKSSNDIKGLKMEELERKEKDYY